MQEKQSASWLLGQCSRLWRSRRSFKGFGVLLFYCHMLMLFSFLMRMLGADFPEYALLLRAGKVLVPLLFTLTSISLFIPVFFWPALALGLLHIPFAVCFILRGPLAAWPWLLGLSGLLALLVLGWRIKLQNSEVKAA